MGMKGPARELSGEDKGAQARVPLPRMCTCAPPAPPTSVLGSPPPLRLVLNNTPVIPLPSLPPGGRGRLLRIGGERSFRRRLMELGLLPGTEVRLVRLVRVGGMVEVEVRGCHLSLRQSEADQIEVEALAP